MSVRSCSRRGCENIMPDRYSVDHGYICDECYNELMAHPTMDVRAFMNSLKRPIDDRAYALIRTYIRETFPLPTGDD